MNTTHFSSVALGLVLLSGELVWADGVSYTGRTGTLFLPNAYTAEQGEFSYQYNTFAEEYYKDRYSDTFNYVMTIGVTPFLEVGGRLAEYNNNEVRSNGVTAGKRDLSGNIKLRLPKLGGVMPDFAIGMNDVSGEAVNFRSQYIVASKKLGKGVYTAGYASGDDSDISGNNGGFASVEYNFSNQLSVMAEYMSSGYNLGASYDFSHLLKLPVTLTASMPFSKEADNNDELVVGVALKIPLTSEAENKAAADKVTLSFGDAKEDLNSLAVVLARYGLERVSVGENDKKEIVIAYENKVYNHSYLDALGLIVGTTLEYVDQSRVVNIVLLDNKVAKLAARYPLSAAKEYFVKNNIVSKGFFLGRLQAWYPSQSYLADKNIEWVAGPVLGNKTWFDISLQPKVRTAIGTEWSEGEYSLALRADLDVPLWKGGSAHIAATAPVSNSTLYDDGRVFSQSRHLSGVQEALLQQVVKPARKATMTGSVGLMEVQNNTYYLAQSDMNLSSESGNTNLYVKAAVFEAKDSDDSVDVAIASIRQELPKYGVGAELAYGQFFEGDKGARLDLSRDLGSADISAYVKYIDNDDIEGGL
jgi:hypothetical protein